MIRYKAQDIICLFLVSCFLNIANIAFAYPQRIISTMPSITETLFALGLENRVVGVTTNCNYPPQAAKKEKIGQMTISLEKLVSLKPDLIIMLENAQKFESWQLKKRGMPVATINPHTVAEVMDSIIYIGSLTGTSYRARSLAQNMKWRLSNIQYRSTGREPASVFIMVGYKPLVTSGRGTFISDIIEQAGGENVVNNRVEYPQISFEEVYRLNPKVIIIPEGLISADELKKDSKLSRLNAVQEDRVLWMDPDVLFRPGPRVVEAVEKIADFIRP